MKLKNSITKKILTSLLIGVTLGTTLTGMAGNTAFADTNSGSDFSQAKIVSVDSPQGQKVVRELQSRYKVIVQEVTREGVVFIWVGQVTPKLYLYKERGGFLTGHVKVGNQHFHFDDYTLSGLTGWYNEKDGCRYYYQPYKFSSPVNCFMEIGNEFFHFNGGGSVDRGTRTRNINGQTFDMNPKTGAILHPENYGWLIR